MNFLEAIEFIESGKWLRRKNWQPIDHVGKDDLGFFYRIGFSNTNAVCPQCNGVGRYNKYLKKASDYQCDVCCGDGKVVKYNNHISRPGSVTCDPFFSSEDYLAKDWELVQ